VDGGETLGGIAVRYGVTVDEIVTINELADRNLVLPGQVLNIPPRMAPPTLVPFPDRDYGYAIAGYSAEGRAIEVFSFGEGAEDVLFVGGIHGGYEWNTVLLAYEIMDYYNGNRDQIPAAVTLNVIPVANPDGLFRVTGREGRFFAEQVAQETRPGRFNGNNVDINRNFSCNWSPNATWGRTVVSPGSAPFSEPETQALRDLITRMGPRLVVFWHSAANLVSPGTCGGEDAGAGELAQAYGIAANYPWGPFSAYDVTGGGSDWVVSLGIPSFAVELISHNNPETGRNLAGVQAMLDLFWAEGERVERGE
jgi:LysM repeat protein